MHELYLPSFCSKYAKTRGLKCANHPIVRVKNLVYKNLTIYKQVVLIYCRYRFLDSLSNCLLHLTINGE